MKTKFHVLVAGKPHAVGVTVHPKMPKWERCTGEHIAVIPDAGVRWYECVKDAAAVIVENGGSMSHLAVVGIEEQFLVLREEDARKKYPPNTLLAIDVRKKRVEVIASND
ncbi:MAG: hypothetical protein JJ979_02575 [Roseibium sp.]|nr:hypothetical protein [Roseibium sp.]